MLGKKQSLYETKERILRKNYLKLPNSMMVPHATTGTFPDISSRLAATYRNPLKNPTLVASEPEQSYYEPYREKMMSIKDVVKNFSSYKKGRERTEVLQRRKTARQKSVYEFMEKDMRRNSGKNIAPRTSRMMSDGKKAETLVKRDTYEITRKGLSTLSSFIDKLNQQYHRSEVNA